ncbi:MAG: hypothetical protein IJB11_03365 [Oscillospiraceae bacterium]|nr:hypothetical protein [Oscillospiraceae bacterium]
MIAYISLIALVAVCLTPLVFIIIGVVRRHKENGIAFFMFGSGCLIIWLSDFLSEYLGKVICKILYSFGITASFYDTHLITVALSVLGIWASYKGFRYLSTRINNHD